MTEQEYIDVGDLEKLSIIRTTLRNICAPCSNVITETELSEIHIQINKWWWELQKNHIEITEDETTT